MANTTSLNGQLNNNDFVFIARALGFTRLDEYTLTTDAIGQPLTLTLSSLTEGYNPYVQVVDAVTGVVYADSDDDAGDLNAQIAPGLSSNGTGADNDLIPNSLTLQQGINYKVQVFSVPEIDLTQTYSYQIQANVPQGNVNLAPRNNQFDSPTTGSSVNFNGELNGGDYTYIDPQGIARFTADEYQLSSTNAIGQSITIALNSLTNGYDPFLQIVNADTGTILADSADDGGGVNARIAPDLPNNGVGGDFPDTPNSLTLQEGINYKIRVTNTGNFPNNEITAASYQLSVSTSGGEVSVAPKITSTAAPLNTPVYRFQNTAVPGTYLYVGEEERQDILDNFPNFTEEGRAFQVGVAPGDNLLPIYRFQNTSQPGTYLYVGEQERQSILANNSNFIEEGLAFEVTV
jgi:hypothetical protein